MGNPYVEMAAILNLLLVLAPAAAMGQATADSSNGAAAKRPAVLSGHWRLTIVHAGVPSVQADALFQEKSSDVELRLTGLFFCGTPSASGLGTKSTAQADLSGSINGSSVVLRASDIRRMNGAPCEGHDVVVDDRFTGELSADGRTIKGKVIRHDASYDWTFAR